MGYGQGMMNLTIGIPLLVAVLGALLFLLCTGATPRSADVKKLALCAWWCGLLAVLLLAVFSPAHFHF